MDLELTSEERRLLERLQAERPAKRPQVEACLERVRAARARGEPRTLLEELVAAGLVRSSARLEPGRRSSARVPQEKTPPPRVGSARQKPPADAPDEETPPLPRPRPTGRQRRATTTTSRALSPDEATLPLDPPRDRETTELPPPRAADPGARETGSLEGPALPRSGASGPLTALIVLLLAVAGLAAWRISRLEHGAGTKPDAAPSPGSGELRVDDDPGASSPPPAPADPLASDTGTSVPGIDRPARVHDQALAAEEAGDYARALALYRGLPAEVRSRFAEDERRASSLEEYRQEIETALAAFDAARAQGRDGKDELAKLTKLRADPRHGSRAGRKLVARILEIQAPGTDDLASAHPAPRPDASPSPAPATPAEVRVRALARVQDLAARIASERAERRANQQAQSARAIEASAKHPLRVELGATVLERALVVDAGPRGFTLESRPEKVRVSLPWNARPEISYEVRKLGARDEPRDQFDLGRFCLENGLIAEARRAFQRAQELDPKLEAKVPNLDALERAAKVFRGRLERTGPDSVSIRYGFQDPAQLEDLAAGASAVRNGRLEVQGTGTFLATWKEIAFAGQASVDATVASSSGARIAVGFLLEPRSPRPVEYLVSVRRDRGDVALWERRPEGSRQLDHREGAVPGASRVGLSVGNGLVQVRVDGKPLLKATASGEWAHASAVVGGISGKTAGSAAFSAVELRGRMRPEWLRKSFEEAEALLRGALAGLDDLPVFDRPDGPRPSRVVLAEPGTDAATMAELESAFEQLDDGSALDLGGALETFAKLLDARPLLLAARYGRAVALERLGQKQAASADADELTRLAPESPDALALRARVLAALGQRAKALEVAEAALARGPDDPRALAARARIRFDAGDLEAALSDLDVALALDPWDGEIRGFRRNVRHVREGPPWDHIFTRTTEHFTVETDISQKKCDLYAGVLEAMRAFFSQRFAAFGAPNEEGTRRAHVLVFDTAEGFHRYAELTTDDRVESLLGYYHPRYRQLLLFEDRDDASGEETLRVLEHEGFHQFIHEVIPELPFWINEGLAEYFSTCRTDEQGRVTDEGGVLPARLSDLQAFLRQGGPEPFARIMNETPREFYQGPVAQKYAQAWSMVHFFEQGAQGRYRKTLEEYLRACVDGKPAVEAYRGTFGTLDLARVTAEWRAYVETLGGR